jgi:hypothetical protein
VMSVLRSAKPLERTRWLLSQVPVAQRDLRRPRRRLPSLDAADAVVARRTFGAALLVNRTSVGTQATLTSPRLAGAITYRIAHVMPS